MAASAPHSLSAYRGVLGHGLGVRSEQQSTGAQFSVDAQELSDDAGAQRELSEERV